MSPLPHRDGTTGGIPALLHILLVCSPMLSTQDMLNNLRVAYYFSPLPTQKFLKATFPLVLGLLQKSLSLKDTDNRTQKEENHPVKMGKRVNRPGSKVRAWQVST